MTATEERLSAWPEGRVTERIVLGSGASVPVRIYAATPAGETSYPQAPNGTGLVWVHGGGFAYGDLDMPEAHSTSESFAAHNVVVISVDYRLCQAGTSWPAPSDDVLTAWEWCLDHAVELGIDPDKLMLGGASAGGNLAAGAVLRLLESPERTMPSGVFLAYPTVHAIQPATPDRIRDLLTRLEDPGVFSAANVLAMYENYLGGSIAEAPVAAIPGTAKMAHLQGFPTTIMVNCEADELRVSGEAFAALLERAGTPVHMVTEPGTEHGHLNRPDEEAATITVRRVVEWAHRNNGRDRS